MKRREFNSSPALAGEGGEGNGVLDLLGPLSSALLRSLFRPLLSLRRRRRIAMAETTITMMNTTAAAIPPAITPVRDGDVPDGL